MNNGKAPEKLFLSVIICIYNMAREAPRTILSALPPYQKNVTASDYEVIVVDNGSTEPPGLDFIKRLPVMARYVRYPGHSVSPVFALNWAALHIASGNRIMFCIDGARIFSDHLVAESLRYASLGQDFFIYTLGWHLGKDVHTNAARTGYNQQAEDELLDRSAWYDRPGNLFSISVLAGSSRPGFFAPIAESNAFVLSRWMLEERGGYNEKFRLPGGGLANHEIFSRYVTAKGVTPICLLSEGTFHQYHGGVATSNRIGWSEFAEEYEGVMGRPYEPPVYTPLLAGRAKPELAGFYRESIEWLARRSD